MGTQELKARAQTARERPLPFSSVEVLPTIEGRKTQFRRAVALPADVAADAVSEVCASLLPNRGDLWDFRRHGENPIAVRCPWGRAGDRLWVRETFAFTDAHEPHYDGSIEYRADNKCLAVSACELFDVPHNCDPRPYTGPWRPNTHLPRWASRALLEITAVRVERLQTISEADARAEGCDGDCPVGYIPAHAASPCAYHYAQVWEALNGPGSWTKNPWVWVVEFKVVQSAALCTDAAPSGEALPAC